MNYIAHFRLCADDPMWADHVEMSKRALLGAANEMERLAAERDALFKAAESAVHDMEKARVWNGMDWYYNPLHPLHYRSALENLRAALDAVRKA